MYLKNARNEVIGRIDTNSDGVQKLYSRNNTFLGEYRPNSIGYGNNGATFSKNGALVGSGNLLGSLLID